MFTSKVRLQYIQKGLPFLQSYWLKYSNSEFLLFFYFFYHIVSLHSFLVSIRSLAFLVLLLGLDRSIMAWHRGFLISSLLFPRSHFFVFGACLSNAVIKALSNLSYELLQSNKALVRSSLKFKSLQKFALNKQHLLEK